MGYTQKHVADLLGVDRSTYCYYELGKIKPDVTTVMKLSRIFGVHYSTILESEYGVQNCGDLRVSETDREISEFNDLDQNEKCLLIAYRLLSSTSRNEVLQLILNKFKDEKN